MKHLLSALALLLSTSALAGWSSEDVATREIRTAMKQPLVTGAEAAGKYVCAFVSGEKGLNGAGTTAEQQFRLKFDENGPYKARVLMVLSDSFTLHFLDAGTFTGPSGQTTDVYTSKVENGCRFLLKPLARSADPEAVIAVTETVCEPGAIAWLKLDPKKFEASATAKGRLSLEYGICKKDPVPVAPPSDLPQKMPENFGEDPTPAPLPTDMVQFQADFDLYTEMLNGTGLRYAAGRIVTDSRALTLGEAARAASASKDKNACRTFYSTVAAALSRMTDANVELKAAEQFSLRLFDYCGRDLGLK